MIMNKLIWKIRFVFHMSMILEKLDTRYYWRVAGIWLDDADYLDVDPEEVAHEEIQGWYE